MSYDDDDGYYDDDSDDWCCECDAPLCTGCQLCHCCGCDNVQDQWCEEDDRYEIPIPDDMKLSEGF